MDCQTHRFYSSGRPGCESVSLIPDLLLHSGSAGRGMLSFFDGQYLPSFSRNGSHIKKINLRKPQKIHLGGQKPFMASGLLLILFAMFTNFTSVRSHYR